jgi:hypothetical protein
MFRSLATQRGSHAAPVLNGRPRVKPSVYISFLCSRKGCSLAIAVGID